MYYLTIPISLLLFWLLKDKLNLSSSKALLWQLIIAFLLFVTCAINIYYNWNYFKQYEGMHTTDYYMAHTIWKATGYGLLFILTIFICSLLSNAKKNNSTK